MTEQTSRYVAAIGDGALHGFPRRKPPGHLRTSGTLAVPRVQGTQTMGHEAGYQWLRSGRLKPAAVNKIVRLFSSLANREKLAEAAELPATRDDFFVTFLFA